MELRNTQEVVRERARTFLARAKGDVYILGTNKYGSSVAAWLRGKGLRIAGFVNDVTNAKEYASYPVLRSMQLPAGASVVNCIVEGRPIDARNNIATWGARTSVDYFALQLSFPDELTEIDFMANSGSVNDDRGKYDWLYGILTDQLSKGTLEKLVNFRYNRDIDFMEGFPVRLAEQYFEPFVELRSGAVFIDGGGFDGATSREFARRHPDHGRIFCFEPNDEAFGMAQRNLSTVRDVTLVKKGLWDRPETLLFDGSLGSASKLSGEGAMKIETTTMDLEVDGQVDFVKLDVEGAERKALQGGARVITEHHPSLAVCVYHDQQDFLRVPEIVLAMVPGYKVYLRHYTQGVFETVMFFV